MEDENEAGERRGSEGRSDCLQTADGLQLLLGRPKTSSESDFIRNTLHCLRTLHAHVTLPLLNIC